MKCNEDEHKPRSLHLTLPSWAQVATCYFQTPSDPNLLEKWASHFNDKWYPSSTVTSTSSATGQQNGEMCRLITCWARNLEQLPAASSWRRGGFLDSKGDSDSHLLRFGTLGKPRFPTVSFQQMIRNPVVEVDGLPKKWQILGAKRVFLTTNCCPKFMFFTFWLL